MVPRIHRELGIVPTAKMETPISSGSIILVKRALLKYCKNLILDKMKLWACVILKSRLGWIQLSPISLSNS